MKEVCLCVCVCVCVCVRARARTLVGNKPDLKSRVIGFEAAGRDRKWVCELQESGGGPEKMRRRALGTFSAPGHVVGALVRAYSRPAEGSFSRKGSLW